MWIQGCPALSLSRCLYTHDELRWVHYVAEEADAKGDVISLLFLYHI
jgi:hypothetical protein